MTKPTNTEELRDAVAFAVTHGESTTYAQAKEKAKNSPLDEWLLEHCDNLIAVILSQRNALLDELEKAVGDDEIRPSEGPKRNGIEQGLRRTRNRLRNELRSAIQAQRNKGKGE